MLTKAIELFIAALIAFFFARINKKLDKAEEHREEQKRKQDEVNKSINNLQGEISILKRSVEEWQMRTARYRIIRFDDEEQEGRSHSNDHWEQIAEDIDMYQTYVRQHPDFQNHKGTIAMERIKRRDLERRANHAEKQCI